MEHYKLKLSLPTACELFPLDCQNRRLYERLRHYVGGITNVEMRDELDLLSYTRRLSDIREKLAPLGATIGKKHLGHGVFNYFLEPLTAERKAA